MDGVPGAWTTLDGASLKLFRPVPREDAPGDVDRSPGTVLVADPVDGLVVDTGAGSVAFDEVQPPGKRRMSVVAWLNGRGVVPGQRFE